MIRSSTFEMYAVNNDIDKYLDELESLFQSEKKEMANTLMREMVGYPFSPEGGFIAPLMSKWNPFLYSSGQNSEYWEGTSSKGLTTLEAVYTGMDIHKFYGKGLPKGVWWEFATPETASFKDPQDRVLGRDYAFYQETGIDIVAQPQFARHKGAIASGVELSAPHLHEEAKNYVSRLIKLQKGKHIRTGKRTVNDMFR